MLSYIRSTRPAVRALLAAAGVLLASACATLSPAEVVEEPGYYYGRGSGATVSAAAGAAKKDLVTKALAVSREGEGLNPHIEVTDEIVAAFDLPNLKPYAQDKTGDSVNIVYRMRRSEWKEHRERRRKAALADIQPRLVSLSPDSGRSLADRLKDAAAILDRLYREALADSLREKGPSGPLIAETVELLCSEAMSGLEVRMDITRGFVDGATRFSGRLADSSGGDTESLPLRAEWKVRSGAAHVQTVRTGAGGSFVLEFPGDKAFLNRSVRLTVSSGLSGSAYGSGAVREADEKTRAEYSFQHLEDIQAAFASEARIPGGEFMVGALERDRRAARREAPRKAVVEDFYMDVHPVTNALYEMFLNDTAYGVYPEFWENPEYNQDDQPVVGVRYEDAVRFAEWLSGQLGVVKRLPSEAEWERAARGGRDVLYPWGDQAPDEGDFANYSGNSVFTGLSPVGCFEDGKNAYGLEDMAGNVWVWTSTPRDEESGTLVVKGGSWMDGPADLRISNRKYLDPRSGYVDVGIRLVREVEK